MGDTSVNTHDAPITSAKDDRLERGPFAKLIAKTLLRANTDGATVIGLTGAWGTGKSSVASMVVEEIGDWAAVLHFEPWMVGSREALAGEFFKTLGAALFPQSTSKESNEARIRFYSYASKITDVLATGANTVGVVVPGVGVFGKAGSAISKLFKLGAASLESKPDEPSLRDVRDGVKRDLAGLPRPVVVVIDDIDRLDRDEVRATFQLIKACADFPNVRYLLLYDRAQVVHALTDSVNNPDAFLEKIVGQSFDLPAATSKQRTEVLDEALSDLGIHEALAKSDMERLSMVFDEVLLPGLPTLRHVKRFVSTVRSLLPGVYEEGFRNIDPADFLALEFLRQYTPEYYAVIRDEDAPAPGGRVARMVQHKEWDQIIADRRKTSLESLAEPLRSLAKEATDSLFKESGSGVASRRFATDYWRPVYLGFHEARAQVSERKWKDFVVALANPTGEQAWLEDWSDRAKRDEWVAAITSRAAQVPWAESLNLLKILFNWGEQQKQETSQFHSAHHSWEFCVRFCVDAIMSVTPDYLNPVTEMSKVLDSTESVVASGYSIGTELERSRKQNYDRWARDYDLEPITKPLSAKLGSMLDDESIWTVSDVSTAITAVYYLVDEDDYKKWWESIPSNEARLIQYLNRNLGEAESFHYGFEEGPLIEAIRKIDPNKLNDSGRTAQELALRSVRMDPMKSHYRRRPVQE